MSSYGRPAVLRSIRRHRRTGKVVSATLYKRTPGTDTFTDTVQVYPNAYLYPSYTTSGLGADGFPSDANTAVLWQVGETYTPQVDDRLSIYDEMFLITAVEVQLNADPGFSVQICHLADEV